MCSHDLAGVLGPPGFWSNTVASRQSSVSSLKTDDWRLATGDWRLATGNWQLATGDWQLASTNEVHESKQPRNFVKSFAKVI